MAGVCTGVGDTELCFRKGHTAKGQKGHSMTDELFLIDE